MSPQAALGLILGELLILAFVLGMGFYSIRKSSKRNSQISHTIKKH